MGSEFGWLFVSKLGPLFDDVVTSASENVILVYIIIVCGGGRMRLPFLEFFGMMAVDNYTAWGREETGGTGQYGSGVRRPGESY